MDCKICEAKVETGYGGDTGETMRTKQLCFTCAFWDEKLQSKDDPNSVRVNGKHYWIASESGSSRGFGGLKFEIEFFDGRKVTSTNLWTQGEIPRRFRSQLADNARFANA